MGFEGPMNTPAQWALSTYEYPPRNELPGLINATIHRMGFHYLPTPL